MRRLLLVLLIALSAGAAPRRRAVRAPTGDWLVANAHVLLATELPSPSSDLTPLQSMIGNVSEWCADPYVDQPGDSLLAGDGRAFAPAARHRTYRGGSYVLPPAFARIAKRFDLAPESRDRTIGLRMARRVDP